MFTISHTVLENCYNDFIFTIKFESFNASSRLEVLVADLK